MRQECVSGLGAGGIAQPEAAVTVVTMTVRLSGEKMEGVKGGVLGNPSKFPSRWETGPTGVCTFIPGSTGEAPEPEDRVLGAGARRPHRVSEAPPGSS